jgi:hypothetical protein
MSLASLSPAAALVESVLTSRDLSAEK